MGPRTIDPFGFVGVGPETTLLDWRWLDISCEEDEITVQRYHKLEDKRFCYTSFYPSLSLDLHVAGLFQPFGDLCRGRQ